MKRALASLGALGMLVSACGNDLSAGRFAFSLATSDDGGVTVDGGASADQAFDLGDLKGSRDFYFLLRNVGGRPITDVRLASSNAAFAVTPSVMDTLDADPTASVVRLVRLSVTHGTALEGVGFAPLLPMGPNTTTLAVSGQTTSENGAALSLSTTVEIGVNALVLDAEIYDGDTLVDWKDSGVEWLSGEPCAGPHFSLFTPRLRNTGNVTVFVTYGMNWNPPRPPYVFGTIAPGETVELPPDLGTDSYIGGPFYFWLDGDHTVGDREREAFDADGRLCFEVAWSSS